MRPASASTGRGADTRRFVVGLSGAVARNNTTPTKNTRRPSRSREQPSLVVSVAGLQGDEVYFKVNPTTLLQKIFDAYANHKGVAGDSLRFLFKGSRVDGELTCADIGFEDGDQLEAENAQDAVVAARDD